MKCVQRFFLGLSSLLVAATLEEKTAVAVSKYGTAAGPVGTLPVQEGVTLSFEATLVLAGAVAIILVAAVIVGLLKRKE